MAASQTPEQNRVARWQNWSIFDCICMILINSGLPPSGLKLSTTWHTWKIATCYVYYKVPPHMRLVSKLNLTFQIVNPSDVRHMSMMAHLARKKHSPHTSKGVFVGYSKNQRLIGYLCPQNGASLFPPMSSSMTLLWLLPQGFLIRCWDHMTVVVYLVCLHILLGLSYLISSLFLF